MPVQRILHRAGNDRAVLPLSRHPAVDAIEADLWSVSGQLVAHHERPLGTLRLGISRHGFTRLLPVPLEALLEVVEDAALVLDLRAWAGDPAPDLARTLSLLDRSRLRVTCEDWRLADRVRAWLPDLDVAYSIRDERQLRAYLTGRDAGAIEPVSVVIRHTLLHTPDEVEALRLRAGDVGVWTVDDTARALELEAWGVDHITSNRLTVLNAL
ncbi:MAG: hypothetical protein C4558_00430 [Dehalococcoidia bacterium]|nr:MAG: hypothetical protein C4558_00430 [Dehalococcoidia bacterium]